MTNRRSRDFNHIPPPEALARFKHGQSVSHEKGFSSHPYVSNASAVTLLTVYPQPASGGLSQWQLLNRPMRAA
jgi:hypothetical protein